MAAPIGDMINQLTNPNANMDLATAITPNPNPLAQQGQQPATSGSPTLPNAAVNKQDPVSANLAYLLLERQRRARAAEGLEQGLGEISAGFGTAQQQQSKQAQLHGTGGGAGGGGIGDVSDIMGIQKQVQDQNEYARFHANVGVFASALRAHGIDVTDDQARVLMDSKPFVDSMGTAFGGNVTKTPETKNVDEAMTSWTAANPKATPEEIAQHRSDILAQSMPSSLDPIEKDMRQDNLKWEQANRGNPSAVKPAWLNDITQYRAHQDVVAAAQKDLTQEKNQFDSTDQKFASLEENIAWLQAHPKEAAAAVLDANWRTDAAGIAGSFPKLTGENTNVLQARKLINQMASQFMGEAIHGLGRISYAEASKLGGALTNLTQRGGSAQDVLDELERLHKQAVRGRATVQAAAGKTLDADHSGFADPQYFDPNDPFYSHATVEKGAPAPGTLGAGASSSGVDRPLQQLDDAAAARVKAAIAAEPGRRDEILKTVRKNGFDPGSL